MNLINSRTDKNLIELFALGIFAVVISFSDICSPFSSAINFSDGSIYQYIGHLMLEGKMPYADAFDHKGILLYLINALACMISERWGIWLINLIFFYLILYFSYLTYRLFISSFLSAIICIVIYSDIAIGHWVWNTPDFFAVLFEIIPIYLIVRSVVNRIELSRKELVVIGLSIAGGFWLKQTVVIPTLLMIIMLCFEEIIRRNIKTAISYIGFILITFLTSSSVVLLYMCLSHVLPEMINDYFIYNFIYASMDTKENALEVVFSHLNNSSLLVTLTIEGIYLMAFFGDRSQDKRIKSDFVSLSGYITLLVIMVWLALFGRPYRQYFLMCYPVLVILSGNSINKILCLKNNSDKNTDRVRCLILHYGGIALCLLAFVAFIFNSLEVYYQGKSDRFTPLSRQILSDNINEICTADDTIAIANNLDTGLYLATGHESATSYPYIQIMLYDNEEFIEDYNLQLLRSQPKVIVSMAWGNDKNLLDEEILKKYYLYHQIGEYLIYAHK